MSSRDKPWWLRAYYAEGVRKQRLFNGRRVGPLVDVSGELAFEVCNASESGLQMDRDAAEARGDIGRIVTGCWPEQ